ncbi:MAG: ATP-dependent 6-phosphofructokinase [Sedimentisphaerales bacterium]|nr:ATP-dependent 6-phosphofructokinase [Sedimentisphaerales bacterium]
MVRNSKTRCIGILTSGGDCPGLNAAVRAIAKTVIKAYGIRVIGILDGFRGLVENRTVHLENKDVSGILTLGGTILGTSRDKPHKMPMGGKTIDMSDVAVANAKNLHIDCLVCLGGGGTQKNAYRLHKQGGINVLTLPKTIDNDVYGTDVSFGYDTGLQIATEAIDRLHTTATSHHRIIVCEVMGHSAGWLALGAGLAGGADVILIPELPYDLNIVAEYLLERRRSGRRFSIVALAEGAESQEDIKSRQKKKIKKKRSSVNTRIKSISSLKDLDKIDDDQNGTLVVREIQGEERTYHLVQEPKASRVARQLQELTGTEARVTSLGHVQRGGVPSAFDRLLCTRLGAKTGELLAEGVYNVMVAYRGGVCVPVPLEDVAGKRNTVPANHPMIEAARLVGTCLGV